MQCHKKAACGNKLLFISANKRRTERCTSTKLQFIQRICFYPPPPPFIFNINSNGFKMYQLSIGICVCHAPQSSPSQKRDNSISNGLSIKSIPRKHSRESSEHYYKEEKQTKREKETGRKKERRRERRGEERRAGKK